MKPFRILGRSIKSAFRSVFRNFSLSIASIICTTITLILVSVAMIISYNLNTVTKNLESELTIVVYVKRDTSEEKVKELTSKLEDTENVLEVKFISKDARKIEMQEFSTALETTLDYLDKNPLLDSYIIKVNDVNALKTTTETIAKYDDVETARYGEGMVEEILMVFDIVEKVTIAIVIALVLVTAFLISNTIKLTIFSRRNEIEIERLVGASNITIKLPFLFEGLIIGVLGSLIPVIISCYGYILMYEGLNGYLFSIIALVKPFNFILYVSLILLVIGAVVGMFGSYKAVRKYLKI